MKIRTKDVRTQGFKSQFIHKVHMKEVVFPETKTFPFAEAAKKAIMNMTALEKADLYAGERDPAGLTPEKLESGGKTADGFTDAMTITKARTTVKSFAKKKHGTKHG